MRTIDLRGRADLSDQAIAAALPRAELDVEAALPLVRPLLEDIAARGGDALAEQAAKFDGVVPPSPRVPAAVIEQARDGLDPAVRTAMELAIERTRRVHTAQIPPDGAVEVAPGAVVSQRWIPVRRVGLYAPGGLVVYPSSVIMNVVPAQAAGVRELAVASPPQRRFGGWPHPTVLAACGLLGVEEVYAAGGASAIGLFAFGLPGLAAKVDVIAGPGNVYVAAAKRLVLGRVGIDAEAGPTEIAIVADATANPEFVAADLVSQAEHDPLAASVLITDSPALAAAVGAAVARRARSTRHAERVTQALSGRQSGVVLVDDLAQAIAVANAYAAEHLELQVAKPAAAAEAIHSAGAIFVGPASPVPLGDYLAGSNHVLPTGGTARFASGLGVVSFLKSVQQIEYDAEALAQVTPLIEAFAAAEDLPAHGQAAIARQLSDDAGSPGPDGPPPGPGWPAGAGDGAAPPRASQPPSDAEPAQTGEG
ncbi:MAG: histidinol dehydrogenase [Bifidobacteriaceae bacterium]|jgi:histidinol dehydrogenase|nr:histidinol dehydrogenase [Bifidobacteriaceae bacterium]